MTSERLANADRARNDGEGYAIGAVPLASGFAAMGFLHSKNLNLQR